RWGLLVFPAADAEALRYAGLALYASGGAVRLAAVWTLGQQFSGYVTLQENHQLVQRGLYRLIRHPIYLGALLAFPGAALVFRSWLAIPVFVFVGMFVAARIRREEKLMSEHFGAEFATYRRSTWRLLPYLY
ncbi:MAG: methyltransferase family protein, partial [Terriglobia bacterium]